MSDRIQRLILLFILLIPAILTAQPETLLSPAKALQGYTGKAYCSVPENELDFEAFLAEIRALPNDRLRFEKIRQEVHEHCLVTPYVFRLMELMENAGLEYDMMRLTYYYCADPDQFDRLLPYMEGASYRESMERFLRERVNAQRPDVEGQRQLMSDTELGRALEVMNDAGSDQSRMAIATEIIDLNNLLCEQVRQLMDLLVLAENRKTFALRAYQKVYDPGNFFLISERLGRKDRKDVLQQVNQNARPEAPAYTSTREVGCTYRVAESEFTRHIGSIEAQARDEMKLRMATQLFENNCFSVPELQKAMQMFEVDQDRLDLAKAAFPHVFDPWNFYLVNTELKRASSVDALFAFLQAQ